MSILDKINEKLDKLKNAFLPLSMRDITKLNLVQLNTRLNDIQKNITSYKNSNKQKRDELIRKWYDYNLHDKKNLMILAYDMMYYWQDMDTVIDQVNKEIHNKDPKTVFIPLSDRDIDKRVFFSLISTENIKKLTLNELHTRLGDIESYLSAYKYWNENWQAKWKHIVENPETYDAYDRNNAEVEYRDLVREMNEYKNKMDIISKQVNQEIKTRSLEIEKIDEVQKYHKYLKYKTKYLKSCNSAY